MLRKLSIILLILTTIFINGCSITNPLKRFHKDPLVSNLPADLIYIDKTSIYNNTLDLINSAQKSIYVEQIAFDDPKIIALLINKAHQGIEVRVLLDQWEKVNNNTIEKFKNQNISAQFYPAQKGQYDQTKLLVVDNKQAIIYGSAWTQSGFNAHNIAVKLTGKSAWKTASVFARDWQFTTTLSLNVPSSTKDPEDNIILATSVKVKQQILEQIESSTKSIMIEVTDLSEKDTIQALTDAAAKHLEIRVLVNSATAKDTPVAIETLQKSGVKIRYTSSNQKTSNDICLGIFDGKTFIMSSSGWSYYSFVINHVFSITVPSPQATVKMNNLFESDWNSALSSLK